MFKSRETKKLLNEWRSFINETNQSQASNKDAKESEYSKIGKDIPRVKHKPSKRSEQLRDLLNSKFSKTKNRNDFFNYEFFNDHSDEEMIGE
jgi:hypothetical protein